MVDRIRAYWDQRAVEEHKNSRATTNDIYLRVLEAEVAVRELEALNLPAGAAICDVGCGDGRTTLSLAQRFPGLRFFGVDFSEEMINLAMEAAADDPELNSRVQFRTGDARELAELYGQEAFEAVTTNRCLINLPDPESQYAALAGIASILKPGGGYVGTENFMGGQANLNAARQSLGLKPIPIRWHNLFFEEDEFLSRANEMFSALELVSFSSAYYYATRVIYSALCQKEGTEPDYGHPIHQVAVQLPWTGDFSPIKLIRARR